MFGHLKAEEFISLLEGDCLERQGHLSSCAMCSARLRSIEAARNEFAMEDQNIPEPDWNDFRDSVRLALLSRSVQREAAVRRWTGWAIRPAMAWGLSFALLIGISVGGFVWHVSHDQPATSGTTQEISPETAEVEDLAAWTGTGVFHELSNLEEPQVERLRALIASQNGVLNLQ